MCYVLISVVAKKFEPFRCFRYRNVFIVRYLVIRQFLCPPLERLSLPSDERERNFRPPGYAAEAAVGLREDVTLKYLIISGNAWCIVEVDQERNPVQQLVTRAPVTKTAIYLEPAIRPPKESRAFLNDSTLQQACAGLDTEGILGPAHPVRHFVNPAIPLAQAAHRAVNWQASAGRRTKARKTGGPMQRQYSRPAVPRNLERRVCAGCAKESVEIEFGKRLLI